MRSLPEIIRKNGTTYQEAIDAAKPVYLDIDEEAVEREKVNIANVIEKRSS